MDHNHTTINTVHLVVRLADRVQFLAITGVTTMDTGMMRLTREIIRHHRNLDILQGEVDHLLKCDDLLKTVLHAMTFTIDVARHFLKTVPEHQCTPVKINKDLLADNDHPFKLSI
jgi:hypothetical protein